MQSNQRLAYQSTACLSCDPRNRHGYCEDDCQGKRRRSVAPPPISTETALVTSSGVKAGGGTQTDKRSHRQCRDPMGTYKTRVRGALSGARRSSPEQLRVNVWRPLVTSGGRRREAVQ
ncbi:hypothetical protein F2P81_011943 [Scophthalmus maximus]|uniref:Uncharacterized protein n=1 Tax=Scophthalmus maximus TaxID=52904 RepID=A0A6A4T045_SCOMX|nr:hypothetical protein F2P81_011943 [Scophthalmus maximus]